MRQCDGQSNGSSPAASARSVTTRGHSNDGLAGLVEIYNVIRLYFDLVSRRKKCIESLDEIRVSLE